MATQMQTLYTGTSGHLAVMAHFLHLGYNAAIPQVDRGDDIFVVRDSDGDLTRVQVKAARGKGTQRHYASYKLRMSQLRQVFMPELYYVFAMHYNGAWRDFLVISRAALNTLQVQQGIGWVSSSGKSLHLRLSFSANDVLCSGQNLQVWNANWNPWPAIQH